MACQKKVPRGWLQCPRSGFLVDGLFIPFKTALDERYDDDIPSKNRFNTKMFREMILEGYVALVIALIDLDPFYNAKDIREVNHIRVKLSKRKGPPSLKKILGFNKLVKLCLSFDSRCKIAVHCLHGYNATGFMIVNFLVMERKMLLQDALEVFATARPPGIYKREYLKQLSVLHDPKLRIIFPRPPEWDVDRSKSELECDRRRPHEGTRDSFVSRRDKSFDSSRGRHDYSRSIRPDRSVEFSGVRREHSRYSRQDSSFNPSFVRREHSKFTRPERTIESSTSRSEYPKFSTPGGRKRKPEYGPERKDQNIEKRQRIEENIVQHFKPLDLESFVIKSRTREINVDFLVPVSPKDAHIKRNILEDIQKIMNSNIRHGFFGQRYIPVTRKTLDKFSRFKYYFTWRTDGRRLMMFIIDQRTMFMIDEMSNYYRVKNFTFPHWDRKDESLRNTILDGELVVDTVQNKDYFNYLVSDIYAFDSRRVDYADYMERVNLVQAKIIIPRKSLSRCSLEEEPFRIQMKTISEMCFLKQTWEKLRLEIPHEMTGLIFYPVQYGDCSRKHIWIPSTHKFVRFYLQARFDECASKWVGTLFTREKEPHDEIKYITEEEKNKYDRHTVKCTYNATNRTWSIIGVDNEIRFLPSKFELQDEMEDMERPITFEQLTKLFKI